MPARNTTYDKQSPKAAFAGAKRLTVAIGREAAANFRAWFERNFKNPRAGRIGGVSYTRAGALDDCRGDPAWYSDAYGRAFWDHTEPLAPDEEDYLRSHPLVLLQLALGVTDLRGLRCLRRGLTLRANALQRKAYRSRYYAGDNARRRMLAAERRKIRRRTTLSPCPTPDEFRAAFARAKESAEAKIRFGGMVHDLACYVDSCLRYDENGNIVGRNGGIRAWIAENAPELSPRYKTIMRHKALAMRVRQLTGLEDPQPTSVLLDEPADEWNENSDGESEKPFGTSAKGLGGEAGKPSGTGENGRGNETESRIGTKKSKGQEGLENYYAQDSHFTRKQDGVMREWDGTVWRPDGLEQELDGLGSKRGRLEQKRERRGRQQERRGVLERQRGQFSPMTERQRELFGQVPEQQQGQLRWVLEQQREQCKWVLEQKRDQIRRVLADCRNTFKDVFNRIDSELG